MGAPRLKPLRVRGTNEQRYARLQKWCRRKAQGKRVRRSDGELPKLGIDYLALWRARQPRNYPLLSAIVDITVERVDGINDLMAAMELPGATPFTDDGIEIIKRAVQRALAERGYTDAAVSAP